MAEFGVHMLLKDSNGIIGGLQRSLFDLQMQDIDMLQQMFVPRDSLMGTTETMASFKLQRHMRSNKYRLDKLDRKTEHIHWWLWNTKIIWQAKTFMDGHVDMSTASDQRIWTQSRRPQM